MKGNLRTLFRNFCLEGSVLGLKYLYLFPDKLSRCFWLVCIAFILQFAAFMAYKLYQRFEDMPTRITIENQFEPVSPLPYPAITLCSPNQITTSAVTHFDQTLVNGNRSSDLTSMLQQLIGFYHFIQIDNNLLEMLQHLIDLNRYTVPEVMVMLPQQCDRFLRYCRFKGRMYRRCRDLFHPILTKHGLCCIFNSAYYYRAKRRNERHESFVPHLVDTPGVTTGLTVIADYEPQDAVDRTIHFAGATRVMFTDWTEFPADDESLLLAPNTESFHMIHPTATYCSDDVRELPATSRKCLFEEEKHLPFFWKYHNSDCDLLCLVRAVEERCKCLLFYLPHLRLQHTCEVTQIDCISETKLNLYDFLKNSQCECPRDCDSRRYHVDTTIGNFNGLPYMMSNLLSTISINKSSAVMHFVFQSPVYEKQKQETVMSLTTLASNLGGVFGLCLGCSVISVFEILFFYYSSSKNCVSGHLRKRTRRTHHRRAYYE